MTAHGPETMRAALYHGHQDVRISNIAYPSIPPGNVAIASKFCGICGSDMHAYYVKHMAQGLEKPHALNGSTPPVPLGHEFAGQILAIGQGCTSSLVPGDKVAVMPTLFDGTCTPCQLGATNVCQNAAFVGYHHQSSAGMSEVVVVPEHLVFRLPDGVDCDVGALVEPLAVAWHATSLVEAFTASSSALILGAGPVGIATLLCLKARGVQTIMVSEPSQLRRERAAQLGASHVYDPRAEDVLALIKSGTAGNGVDASFDCAGIEQTLNTSLRALRPKGTAVVLALWFKPASVDMNGPLMKEASLKFSMTYTKEDFGGVIEAIRDGRLAPQAMITKRIRLEDVVRDGLESLHTGDSSECKILVDMSL